MERVFGMPIAATAVFLNAPWGSGTLVACCLAGLLIVSAPGSWPRPGWAAS